jgi:hypothetical protein
MGINFPNSPTLNQLWPSPAVAGQPQYHWDGEKWAVGTVAPPAPFNLVPIAAGADLNTITAMGFYYTSDNTSLNAPTAGHYWYLQVYSVVNSYVEQVAVMYEAAGAVKYTRTMIASVWGPWHRTMYGDNNLSEVTNITTARQSIFAAPYSAIAYDNIAVNARMEISQAAAFGATAPLVNGAGANVCDCWHAAYNHAANTAVIVGYVDNTGSTISPPVGFNSVIGVYASTAMTTQANGDYFFFYQTIEGTRMSRLGWGTANAQPLSYGFMFYTNCPGTSFVRITNAAQTRVFYQEFNAPLNGWNFISGTIPGCPDGAWVKDNTAAAYFVVFISGKTATPPAPGAWLTGGGLFQTTNSQNLSNVNTSTNALSGLLLITGSQFPTSQVALQVALSRSVQDELQLCKRYLQRRTGTAAVDFLGMLQAVNTTVAGGPMLCFAPEMRAAPTITVSANADITLSDAGGNPKNATALSLFASTQMARGVVTIGTASLLLQGATICGLQNGGWIQADARI